MMEQRKKLTDLFTPTILESLEYEDVPNLIGYLLASGVVVLPCKVGDTVYYLSGTSGKLIKSAEVEEIIIGDNSWCVFVFSDMYNHFVLQEDEVYFTRKEAEAALKKMEGEK